MKIIIKRPKASTVHTALTLVWAALVPPTLLWWRESVLWVALMSLWANIASHWAAREAARAKEKRERACLTLPTFLSPASEKGRRPPLPSESDEFPDPTPSGPRLGPED